MFPLRLTCQAVAIIGATAALVFSSFDQARAQGQLKARYSVSLSGLPVGTGSWFVGIGDDQYQIGVNGSTAGVARLFSNGSGVGGASGKVVRGALVPTNFTITITSNENPDQVSVEFADGTVKTVSPRPTADPGIVPLTDAHYRGAVDPLTGSLVHVPGAGDPVRPEACQGTAAIFNGHMRVEIRRSFKRMESVAAWKGYQGPAVVCALNFTPIAGHNPGRASLKYLAQVRDMEVALAPITNTRILAPFRFSLPTPFGVGLLEATDFESVATPGRRASIDSKSP